MSAFLTVFQIMLVFFSLCPTLAFAETIVGVIEKDRPDQESVAKIWLRPLFRKEDANKEWEIAESAIKRKDIKFKWKVFDLNGRSLGDVETSVHHRLHFIYIIRNTGSLPQEFVSPLIAISEHTPSLANEAFQLSEKEKRKIVEYGLTNISDRKITYCSNKKPSVEDFKISRAKEFTSHEKFLELTNDAETFCGQFGRRPARLSFFLWSKGNDTGVDFVGDGLTYLSGGDLDGDKTSSEILLFDSGVNTYALYSKKRLLRVDRIP